MTKLVGISGAQGGGKTTLINGLKERGWATDPFKVSRAVQAELGWESLERVMDDVETMKRFQEEVLRQKLLRDFNMGRLEGDGIVLTERTFADIAAYTTHWCWEHVDRQNWSFNEAVGWLTPYLERCAAAQLDCYDAVVLLPYMSSVKWEADPNRAGVGFRDSIYEDIEKFCERQPTIKHFIVTQPSIEGRVNEVDIFLRSI
jgi:nicotinamide riboside kinase